MGARRGGGPEGWGPHPTQKKWGPEGWGPEGCGPKPRKSGGPKGGGPEKVGARRVGARRVGAQRVEPRRVGAQNFAPFFPSPATKFVLFFPLWGSSRGILVVFEAAVRSNVHVWSSLVVMCEPRRPGLVGPPGFHTTTREPKRAHLRVPAFKNTTKIQREHTQRGKKRTNFAAGEGKKKSEILGGPGEGRSRGEGGPGEGRSSGEGPKILRGRAGHQGEGGPPEPQKS